MKKNYSKSLFCFILCIGVLIGFGRVINDSEKPSSSSTHEIISRGIEARMLSSTTNSYGEKDQVFAYSFTPANATNQEIEVSLKYADNTDCTSVMNYTLDSENKKITLSCKAAFAKKINVVLKSKANTNATATIILDYVKKTKSLVLKESSFSFGKLSKGDSLSLSPLSFVSPTYSIFTKDKNYTFKTKVNGLTIQDNFPSAPTAACEAFIAGLKTRIESGSSYFTADELWNLDTSNSWRSILKATTIDDFDDDRNCFSLSLNASFTCVEDSSITCSNPNIALYCSLYGPYTGTVNVDSVKAEVSNIDF